ncbi:MAG TPA: glutamate--tRNA ligase, partial [Rhodospirillales bacterium]|nr:glutamate--tRNA ligase [Rhodospirillales bacterium]
RTALFNWLYARHHDGKLLLRIEDTDRKRSTEEAVQAIYDGLTWLGLDWDGEAVSQAGQIEAHRQAAQRLLAGGHAYRCYCSPEELTEMREQARAEDRPMRYDGRWRERPDSDAPAGIDPVIRLKAPQSGETVIADRVQGDVRVANDQLDDMILLRADGTPTYMLAVVVDDHDMGITDVIRGDDHLTNAFRQFQLYKALGWQPPKFAHIPLIHGADGAKLSKRHGALGIESYRDDGFIPEAIRNYLLRLGWSHGDEEFISTEQAIDWFDVESIGKSPSRFDVAKLTNLNARYLRQADDRRLVDLILPLLSELPSGVAQDRLLRAMAGLKERAKTIVELADNSRFYVATRPLKANEKALGLLSHENLAVLAEFAPRLGEIDDWKHDTIEAVAREFAEARELKLGKLAQPLRAALTGSTVSPGIFDVMEVLGQQETIGRLQDAQT